MLYIASDHGGYALKERLKSHLTGQGIQVQDLGPSRFDPADDYPDFAGLVAQKVSEDPVGSRGILLCRSGQGVNIVANKYPHVRAALVWNTKEAEASRRDDLANILSIPTDYISESDAVDVLMRWLETPLGTEERHVRRIEKIEELERKLHKNS